MTRERILFLLLAAAYVAVRLIGYSKAPLVEFPGDSPAYLGIAARPLFSDDFLASIKPLGVPLVYKLAGGRAHVGQVQLIASVGSWLALAGTVAAVVRERRLKPVAFALVLLFSLSIWITQWDKLVLSESLSLSLGALAVAAWIGLAQWPRPLTAAAALLVTLLWVFTRDTNAYVLLFALPVAAVWLLRSRGARLVPGIALAGACLVTAGSLANANASKGCFFVGGGRAFPEFSPSRAAAEARGGPCLRRWYTLMSTISVRVLPDRGGRSYFVRHGMPLPAVVRRFSGQFLAIVPNTYTDPSMVPFRRWFNDHGPQTYATWVLSHPAEIFPPTAAFGALLSPGDRSGQAYPPLTAWRGHAARELPEPLQSLVYPPRTWELGLELLLVAALTAAAIAKRSRLGRPFAVAAFLVAMTPLHALVVWHGDPADVTRHGLLVGVLARLGLLIAGLLAVDALLGARMAGRREPSAADPV